jgi:splicing factor 3B subunit 4
MRDPESGTSKGYGFVSYDNFDSSDTAMNSMNGFLYFERDFKL